MEWLLVAVIIWWFLARNKKRKKASRLNWAEVERNKRLVADEQAEYNAHMESLPNLQGDGSFSQDVVGEAAYREILQNYSDYLERYHPGENELLVALELEPDNPYDENAVRVEGGKTTLGYIPRGEAKQLGDELRKFGGKATCTAYFHRSDQGLHWLTLDLVRPLRLAKL